MLTLLIALATIAFAAGPGTIDTVAGTGAGGVSGDGGKAVEARFDAPFHCDFDADGNVYIADSGNHRVRKVLALRLGGTP